MKNMVLFVNLSLFTLSVLLLNAVRGHLPGNVYSKLGRNMLDQLYAWLCGTDSGCYSMQECASRCSIDEMCTLFQLKDEQCKLYRQEVGPGIGITSLAGMTEA